MKQTFTLLILLAICNFKLVVAQPAENPGDIVDKLNIQLELVSEKYLRYMSELAHGTKAKKAVKKHEEFLAQIDKARYSLAEIPYYKGDKSLHEATKTYLNLITNLQKENYSKVVNMEEIAEKSYDAMEAYLLFKRKINERMDEASAQRVEAFKGYFDRHNITLIEGNTTERDAKMEKLDEVMEYYDMVYLIFFKAKIHDEQLVEAMDKRNLTAVEQIKSSLLKYSDEGLQRLDTLKGFRNGDATLKNACRRSLEFFKKEATMIDDFTDYLMQNEDFATIKKNFERNSKAQSDKAEIKKYNDAVNEVNKANTKSNEAIQKMNKGRSEVVNNWNDAVKRFLDSHIPFSK